MGKAKHKFCFSKDHAFYFNAPGALRRPAAEDGGNTMAYTHEIRGNLYDA